MNDEEEDAERRSVHISEFVGGNEHCILESSRTDIFLVVVVVVGFRRSQTKTLHPRRGSVLIAMLFLEIWTTLEEER